MPAPWLLITLLLALGVSIGSALNLSYSNWNAEWRSESLGEVFTRESRRMLANQFMVKADTYLTRGYYPSVFDALRPEADGERKSDWIERFGRHFYPSALHEFDQNEGEILPWLRLAAELDPSRVETYLIGSYWLRQRLGRHTEAEQFVREGLRHNPGDVHLLTELGTNLFEGDGDPGRTRNIWEGALEKWKKNEHPRLEPDWIAYRRIVGLLARLEESQGRIAEAEQYWQMLAAAPSGSGSE